MLEGELGDPSINFVPLHPIGIDHLSERLTLNDRLILVAMLELQVTKMKCEKATTIIQSALYKGDEKRAFDRLKRLQLVGGKGGAGGGMWLTEQGQKLAKLVQSIGATE